LIQIGFLKTRLNMYRISLLPLFIFIMYCSGAFAQSREQDSLKAIINLNRNDSTSVNALIELSKTYLASNVQLSLHFAEQANQLAVKIRYAKGFALSYKAIAISHFNKGDYVKALQNYESSLAVFDSIGDKKGAANIYSNMGNIYFNKGDDVKALELFLKSLKIAEAINDTLRMVTCMGNVGAVYALKQNTYPEALSYLIRAYDLCEAMTERDAGSIGAITVNIGEIYYNNGVLDSALYYYEISLKAVEGTQDEPYTLNDIGLVYKKQKNYDKAIAIQKKAYDIAKSLEAKSDISISLVGLAQTYLEKRDYQSALSSYKEAENFAKEIGSNYGLRDIYEGLSKVYTAQKDYANANKYLELLIGIKDTLYNIDANKKLGTLQFTFDIEKKEGQINLLTKDQELKAKEISRQKLVRNSFIGGFAVVLLFAGVFFTQRNRISKEKKRSDELLLNILPEETAEELKATGTAKAKSFDSVSVLFTDFKNFTQASERLSAEELVQEINYCYSEFDKIVTKYNIEKIKTIGDAYMCAGGLPVANSSHPEDVVRAGIEMQEFIARNKKERMQKDQPYFELRLGIHTGPVVAGIVGIKKFAYDIWGDTVNTASRMESSGETGKVNISGTTYELVKDKFKCFHRGKIQAKNKGEIDMYFVEGVA